MKTISVKYTLTFTNGMTLEVEDGHDSDKEIADMIVAHGPPVRLADGAAFGSLVVNSKQTIREDPTVQRPPRTPSVDTPRAAPRSTAPLGLGPPGA